MSTIDLTDDELAAAAAAFRRAVEEDRFPPPRASTRCALRWQSLIPQRQQRSSGR
jgi:hypothetical protein